MGDMSVQDTEMNINKVTDKSLESTRRMLPMVLLSQEKGITTMIMLDKQGKQLMNAEENVDEIKENVKIAQKNLNKLSKWWGGWLIPNRRKSIKNDQRFKQVSSTEKRDDGGVISRNVTALHNTQRVTVQSTASPGPYSNRISNDAREKEMEENLEQVSGIIATLKNMAIAINNELDKQNETIDRVTNKVEITTGHVVAATKKANKLIKK